MTKTDRHQVWVKLRDYARLEKLKGNKSFSDFITILLDEYPKRQEQKLEIERLELEIEKYRLLISEKPSEVEAPNMQVLSLSPPQPQKAQSIITNPLDYDCHYRAYDPETGKIFCDGKEMPKVVCMNRHGRFASMEKRCYPKGMKFKRRPRQPDSEDREDRDRYIRDHTGEAGDIYKGDTHARGAYR